MKIREIYLSLVFMLSMGLGSVDAQERTLVLQLNDGNIKSFKTANLKSIRVLPFSLTINTFDGLMESVDNLLVRKIYFESGVSAVPAILQNNDNAMIYPNPTQGTVYFKSLPEGKNVIRIVNMSGVLLFEGIVNSSVNSLDLSFLPKGIFLVQINSKTTKLIMI